MISPESFKIKSDYILQDPVLVVTAPILRFRLGGRGSFDRGLCEAAIISQP